MIKMQKIFASLLFAALASTPTHATGHIHGTSTVEADAGARFIGPITIRDKNGHVVLSVGEGKEIRIGVKYESPN